MEEAVKRISANEYQAKQAVTWLLRRPRERYIKDYMTMNKGILEVLKAKDLIIVDHKGLARLNDTVKARAFLKGLL